MAPTMNRLVESSIAAAPPDRLRPLRYALRVAGATGMAILFHLLAGRATHMGLAIASGLAVCAALVSSLRGASRSAGPAEPAAEIG